MKKICKSAILSILLLISTTDILFPQKEAIYPSRPVTLSQYLVSVMKGNLGYIAEQFNVSIAVAELKAARVFPDPEISLAYSNNEDKKLQMGQSFEAGMSYPVSLGNKRGANVSLAKSQLELSQLILDTYFQNLRAEAALSYFSGLRSKKIYLLQKEIGEQLTRLAITDSIRFSTGEASEIDALQSSLEARSQFSEVYQSFADMQNTLINLTRLEGKKFNDTINDPVGDFPLKHRDFNLDDLLINAVRNRADLMVAVKNKEVSDKYLNLLKANRAFEFSLEAGYSYNSIVKNEIAPAPAYNGLSAGLAIPLKFSNLNKGSVESAELAIRQSQTFYEETESQIISEVIQAYNNFIAQNKKLEHYNLGLVEDAGKILQGRIYSYQHGESGLIDVLNARRTYTELQLNYIEALFDYSTALIELERAAGIWDLP